MEDANYSDQFHDEDGVVSVGRVGISGMDSEFDRGDTNLGTIEDGDESSPHDNISGRNLDGFLEAGFQATKANAGIFPRLNRSSSYDSILNATEDGNTGITQNPREDTESGSTSKGIPLSAFWRQRKYWSLMLVLGVANSSDATEILCISYILADPVFQDTVLKGHGAGLLAAAVFLGMLLGGLLVGTMGDWVGRKPMLLLGLVCNAIAGCLFALAPNFYVLSLLRCIAGFGIGATIPPLFTLSTELAPPSVRGFCTTVIASFWMVGSIYVALMALWCFEGSSSAMDDGDNSTDMDSASDAAHYDVTAMWRVFALICSIPSALGATLCYLMIPESPRFLGLEGRSREALEIANTLVDKMSGVDSSPVLPLTIEELERTFPATALRDLEDRQRQNNTVGYESGRVKVILGFLRAASADFVASTSKLYVPNLRRTTLALKLVWFSLSFGSYGLMTWINIIFEKVHLKNVYFNALLFAAANLPGNLLAAIFMDRIKRSTSLISSIACASASLVLFAVSANRLDAFGIVASACLFQCFTIVSWNTIDTMTSELFPTLVRSTGWGICAASARIGAMIAQFVNGALVDNDSPVLLLLVASGTLMIGALTPCLLPGGAGDMTGKPVHDDLTASRIERNLSFVLIDQSQTKSRQWSDEGIVRRTTRSRSLSNTE